MLFALHLLEWAAAALTVLAFVEAAQDPTVARIVVFGLAGLVGLLLRQLAISRILGARFDAQQAAVRALLARPTEGDRP